MIYGRKPNFRRVAARVRDHKKSEKVTFRAFARPSRDVVDLVFEGPPIFLRVLINRRHFRAFERSPRIANRCAPARSVPPDVARKRLFGLKTTRGHREFFDAAF